MPKKSAPLTLGQLFDDTLKFCFTTHVKETLKAIGVSLLTIIAACLFIGGIIGVSAFLLSSAQGVVESPWVGLPLFIGGGLLLVLWMAYGTWLYNYWLLLIVNEERSVKKLMQDAIPLILPMIGLQCCLLVLMLPAFVPYGLGFAYTMMTEDPTALFISVPLMYGYIFLFILPKLSFSYYILVKERTGVFESIKLSFVRTKGYYWKIIGNALVCIFALMAAMYAALFVVMLPASFFMGVGIALLEESFAIMPMIIMVLFGLLAFTVYVLIVGFMQALQTRFLSQLAFSIFKHPRGR